MPEVTSLQDSPMLTLLFQSAAREGVTPTSLGAFGDFKQQVRRVQHLLPQIWPQFDEASQKQLYELALRQRSAAPQLTARQWLKVLPGLRQAMREVFALLKQEGTARTGAHLLEYQKVHEALLDTIIALYEGTEGRIAADQDEAAAAAIVPELHANGLRYVEFERRPDRGLRLRCFITPEVEYEYEPTHEISVRLTKAVNASGGWVNDIAFIPVHAQ